ncbi:MAG: 1-deoxy-D-xylulose-5-phosphate synthase [Phycisphaerae bacterium]|nr:1-deoxy-D-xylulose-5-phosphate synthase [Phycisphaerae bacterium]
MSLIESINSSADVKKLSTGQLRDLAAELRELIANTVSRTGGHVASNLGVVELTLAIHHCFDFPPDRLIWDVGHQCYVDKIVTGRRDRFATLRQRGGISGFPDVRESDHDQFSVGHAGTAIATAVGLAHGDYLANRSNRIIAVVGDGSIVNGLSFEGLNNAGLLKRQLLIVLNDNSMAIDVTQGGLAKHLNRVRFTHAYEDLKRRAHNILDLTSVGRSLRESLQHLKQGVKTALSPSQIFEQMGLTYLGPIDGHDLPTLIRALKVVGDAPYPIILHVHTEKGRGCRFASSDPCKFHSPSGYEINGDEAIIKVGERESYTCVFGRKIVELAEKDEKIVALTAAMPDGTGLVEFRKQFPDRYFDVGICESAAVDLAAGLAKSGHKPVVAIYSTFLQRAFDQVWQEVVLQGLPVVFALDRAGLVGSDGAVHHGFADLAFLQVLPQMICCAPADGLELEGALEFAVHCGKAVAIRYPRDLAPDPVGPAVPFELGKARVLREGGDATILAYGSPAAAAMIAAQELSRDGLNVGVVSARFAKPLDQGLIADLIGRDRPLIVLEDHSEVGGFGASVLQAAAQRGLPVSRIRQVGLPANQLIPHGSRSWQLELVGLDADGIARTVREALGLAGPEVAREGSPRQAESRARQLKVGR